MVKGDFNLEQMRRSSGHRKIAIFRIFKKIAIFDFLENMAEMTNFPLSGTFWGVKKKYPQKSPKITNLRSDLKKTQMRPSIGHFKVFPKNPKYGGNGHFTPKLYFSKKNPENHGSDPVILAILVNFIKIALSRQRKLHLS